MPIESSWDAENLHKVLDIYMSRDFKTISTSSKRLAEVDEVELG